MCGCVLCCVQDGLRVWQWEPPPALQHDNVDVPWSKVSAGRPSHGVVFPWYFLWCCIPYGTQNSVSVEMQCMLRGKVSAGRQAFL